METEIKMRLEATHGNNIFERVTEDLNYSCSQSKKYHSSDYITFLDVRKSNCKC